MAFAAWAETVIPPSQISMAGWISSAQLMQGLPSLCLASQYPLTSPGTPPALAPSTLELFLQVETESVEAPRTSPHLNMSRLAAAGAVSLATSDRAVPLAR